MPVAQLQLLAIATDEKPDLKTGLVFTESKSLVRDLGCQLTRRANDETTCVRPRHSPHCTFFNVPIFRLASSGSRFLSVLLEGADASFNGRNEEAKCLTSPSLGPHEQVAWLV